MSITDPIADTLTKIRNASRQRHPTVEVRASRFTEQMVTLLKQEGFVRAYKVMGQSPQRRLRIYLKYGPNQVPAITQLVRISKPGQRRYTGADKLPRVLSGLGRAILTTSKGLMTDQEARRQRMGGEVMCYVW